MAKQQMLQRIEVNGGRDRAHLVYELEPGDERSAHYVTHAVVTTQRMCDRLSERRLINPDQHLAATMLRDDYDRSGASMGSLAAQDAGKPYVSGGAADPISFADEGAFRRYNATMQHLGRDWRGVVRHVVIDDGTPEAYGARTRSNGLAMLVIALDKLVSHYGLVAKRRGQQNV